MSSSTDRRLAAAVAIGGGAVVVAVVAVTTSSMLRALLMLAAVGAAWFATDRVLRTTRTLAVRSREQGELFDHMLRSIDDERAALAHRLHDGPQQTMTAVRLMGGVIADAVRSGDDHRATEVLRRLEQLASDAADDLRRTVAGLHPVVMEQRGLVQALGSLAETVHEEYGVDARFTKPSSPWTADDDRDTAIYQIAREAAINAARHGRPPVTIRLEQEDGRLFLTVDDSGGTLTTTSTAGIGLRMMRERAARIGAALTMDSRPGRWSTVRLEMPTVTGPPAR
jgi:signal transduction histidine kinase